VKRGFLLWKKNVTASVHVQFKILRNEEIHDLYLNLLSLCVCLLNLGYKTHEIPKLIYLLIACN